MAIPTKDVSLVAWSSNVDARLAASPGDFGVTPAIAAAYHAVHAPFVDAYQALIAARASGTRSESQTALKDGAKFALLKFARPLYRQVQSNTAVPPAAKVELGIALPDPAPGPRPVPVVAPVLTVVSVDGRLVRCRLADPANPTRRRLPLTVDGATVLSFVGGDAAPADPGLYKYEGGTSRSTFDVLFGEGVRPGTKVWLTACFFNDRKQNGPACAPVGAIVNYGGTIPMAA
jgi:hypothetical protein